MDTRQYINSGVLEAYLLGIASEEDQQQVRQMAAVDPEVSTALQELEKVIEAQLLQNAVPPPANTGDLLYQHIIGGDIIRQQEQQQTHSTWKQTGPNADQSPYVDVEVNDTHLRVHKYWRPAFIAVFILSKVFLVLALYYFFKANSLEQEVERLKTEIRQTSNR